MAIDELTYPQPVANRAGPGPSSPPAPVSASGALPRSRIFHFALGANAGRRSTRSFGPLRAPAIIWSVEYTYTNASTPTASAMELGLSPVAASEDDVLVAVARPYTPIGERITNALSGVVADLRGWFDEVVGGQARVFTRVVRYVVRDAEQFLTVSHQNAAGGGGNVQGTVIVIEAVSESTAAAFP